MDACRQGRQTKHVGKSSERASAGAEAISAESSGEGFGLLMEGCIYTPTAPVCKKINDVEDAK